jgi:hypothetical protein
VCQTVIGPSCPLTVTIYVVKPAEPAEIAVKFTGNGLNFNVIHGHANFRLYIEHDSSKGMVLVILGFDSHMCMHQLICGADPLKVRHLFSEIPGDGRPGSVESPGGEAHILLNAFR